MSLHSLSLFHMHTLSCQKNTQKVVAGGLRGRFGGGGRSGMSSAKTKC